MRVGRALAALPAIRSAFAAGEISYSKVRAITRMATPALEASLVEMARYATAAQLELIVREHRKADPARGGRPSPAIVTATCAPGAISTARW